MKTVKNVSAVQFFPAGAVLPASPNTIQRKDGESDEDFKTREEEARKRMFQASAMPEGEERTKAYDELVPMLLPELAAQLAHYGVKLPSDRLGLRVTLGHFLFDLYVLSAKQPTGAPLMQALYQKRLQDLAERMEKDEVSLKPEELSVVRIGLEDEKAWDNVRLSTFAEVNGEKRYVVLNSKAAPYFQLVINAATDYILSYDQQEASNS